MKVIIVGPAFPLRGGIAHLNEALARAFQNQDIETEIISFSLQYPEWLFPGRTQKEEGEPPADLTIHSLINSIHPLNWRKVSKFIKSKTPDLVIFRYWLPLMAPCLGTIARGLRKAGIPVMAIADNIIPHEKRIGDKMLTQYFVNSCDAFVVMSKTVEADLKQFDTGKPVRFIPHPIYDIFGEKVEKQQARSKLGLKPDGRYMLFFGFVRQYKGLDLLLKAMGSKKLKKLKVKLIVAGEFYEDRQDYEKLIAENSIEDQVILKDEFIPKEDVKNYFCAADIIVQPYHTATQSGVTQIAYHFERPMLVTDVGGLSEMVPDQKVGYVVDRKPEAIASSLADFYENDREGEFASNAAVEKKKYSWESMVEGILGLHEKVKI